MTTFHADILISTPDGITLVAEAKASFPDLANTEHGLKRYMVQMQVPVGLLITPERMWVFRDSYTALSPDSIQQVGEFNLKTLWKQPPPSDPVAFEIFVQHWLEDLTDQRASELPDELRQALRENVVPAVASGDVRAAHPRYS